jgi:N-acetylcysteine deacetylase
VSATARRTATRDPIDWERLVGIRRRLHQTAELRFREIETARLLRDLVAARADRVTTDIAGTGILAELDGAAPGRTVLLRAELDGYPVQEEGTSSYRSRNDGVSHACGHDAHMTVMYGVFERLANDRPDRGSIHVLFQPAEEIPFGQPSGARAMLDSGVLADSYAAVLGLHCWPQLEAGSIGIDGRIAMAAKDGFQITVMGAAVHAATPRDGRDALLAASSLVAQLYAVVSRRRNPDDMVAFNIGTMSGGMSQSLVAPSAVLTGTLRTHDDALRAALKAAIGQVCAGIGLAHDVDVRLEWADAMPAVLNDPTLVNLATRSLAGLVEVESIATPPMTTDDFALYAERWPGLYLKLGVGAPGARDWPSLHSPGFDIDEECLRTGVGAIETLTRAVIAGEEGN